LTLQTPLPCSSGNVHYYCPSSVCHRPMNEASDGLSAKLCITDVSVYSARAAVDRQ